MCNAPATTAELKLAVEGFNQRTLSEGDVLPRTRYTRWFFRESWGLPRTYRGSTGALGGDSIDDHRDNLLLDVSWSQGLASARYTFYERGVAK